MRVVGRNQEAAPSPQGSFAIRVGERIRWVRKLAGETQAEAGAAIGVMHQQFQKIESGAQRIFTDQLCRLAGHYGLEPAFFLDGIGAKEDSLSMPPVVNLDQAGPVKSKLVRMILRLDEAAARDILSLIQRMTAASVSAQADLPSRHWSKKRVEMSIGAKKQKPDRLRSHPIDAL